MCCLISIARFWFLCVSWKYPTMLWHHKTPECMNCSLFISGHRPESVNEYNMSMKSSMWYHSISSIAWHTLRDKQTSNSCETKVFIRRMKCVWFLSWHKNYITQYKNKNFLRCPIFPSFLFMCWCIKELKSASKGGTIGYPGGLGRIFK